MAEDKPKESSLPERPEPSIGYLYPPDPLWFKIVVASLIIGFIVLAIVGCILIARGA